MKTKLFSLALALALTSLGSFCQTPVPEGEVYGFWNASDSPYLINGDIRIPNDSVLSIEAGTEILFTGHYSLYVEGEIKANGREGNEILFSVTDTSGYSEGTHSGWGGLVFNTDSKPIPGTSEFHHCLFEYGKASGDEFTDNYGGVVNAKEYVRLVFQHCSFSYNYARNAGGVLYVNNFNALKDTIRIKNCEFMDNVCGRKGVYAWGGAISASGNMAVTNSSFLRNSSSGPGGAVNLERGNFLFESVIFESNYTDMSGGAISSEGNILLINTIVANNGAARNAGGISVLEDGEASLVFSSVYRNYAQTPGSPVGAGITNSGKLHIANTFIGENSIEGIGLSNPDDLLSAGDFESGGYNLIGNIGRQLLPRSKGDVFGTWHHPVKNLLEPATDWPSMSSYAINGGRADISPYEIPETDYFGNPRKNGEAPDIGAVETQAPFQELRQIAVYPDSLDFGPVSSGQKKVLELYITNANHTDLTINEITVPGNLKISLRGSGAYPASTLPAFSLDYQSDTCLLIEYSPDHQDDFEGSFQISSNAVNYPSVQVKTSGKGTRFTTLEGEIGGLNLLEADSFLITDNIVIPAGSKLVLSPATVFLYAGNYSIEVEGALDARGTKEQAIRFIPYSESGWGGISFYDNHESPADSSILDFCEFEQGVARENNVYSKQVGGALYISGYHHLRISNCSFRNNIAHGSGGAIYMEYSDAFISNNYFHQNECGGSGGGIHSRYCNGKIVNNVFYGNLAGLDGGAVYSFLNPAREFSNNYLSNNQAFRYGGGLYVYSSLSAPGAFLNSILCNNTARVDGGGIFTEGTGSALFMNNTIASNHATVNGGGYMKKNPGSSTPDSIVNSIFWRNEDQFGTNDFIGIPKVSYTRLSADYQGVGNITDDPEFVSPSQAGGIFFNGMDADWRLKENSPCINKGFFVNDIGPLPAITYYGEGRLNCVNDTIDMGAYEYFTGVRLPSLKNESVALTENREEGYLIVSGLEIAAATDWELLPESAGIVSADKEAWGIIVADSAFFNHEINPEARVYFSMENFCGSVTDSLLLLIDNENEAPFIDSDMLSFNYDELMPGAVITTLEVRDEDAGDQFEFSIYSGNEEGYFSIGSSSGIIQLEKELPNENREENLGVNVSDLAGLSDTATLLIKINKTATGIAESEEKAWRVYIEDGYTKLRINFAEAEKNRTVSLYDLGGKRLLHRKAGETNFVIHRTNFKRGVYLLRIDTSKGSRTEKLVL